MTLEQLVGSKLVIGFPGNRLSDEIIRQFQETHAGGLILFRRNFKNPNALVKLIQTLEEALERHLIVMIDHEGGRVIHFPEGVTFFPDNLAMGQAGDEQWAEKQGEIEAKELGRFGIHLNLSPVLDVLTERHSPNIGIRSYGRDPELVARLGAARIRGMQSQGISACAKQSPGQGQSTVDAHLGLPVLEENFDKMRACHLKPFLRAIQEGVHTIMSSHPLYPNWEIQPKTPATFSRKIMTDYLRKELGFRGLLLTDDMEMKAIQQNWSLSEAGVKAAEAGHDLILCCSHFEMQMKIYRGLLEGYRKKSLALNELERSIERIRLFKDRHNKTQKLETPCPEKEGIQLAEAVAQKGLRILKENKNFKIPLQEASVFVIFPKLAELADKFAVETALLSEKNFCGTFLKNRSGTVRLQFISLNPGGEEIKTVLDQAVRSEKIIFFCWDAHLSEGCRKLLDRLQEEPGRLVVALLRNPYDGELIKEGVLALTAFGFRACQIRAVFNRLLTEGVLE